MDFSRYVEAHTINVKLENDNVDLIKNYLPKHYVEIKNTRFVGKENNLFVYEVVYTTYSHISYEALVNSLVRQQYPESEEFKILREAINNGVTAEYQVYNTYVEQCKLQAKEWVANRDSLLNT